MGCAITKSQHRIIDSSSFKQNATPVIDIVTNCTKLIAHFTENGSLKPKCIFIFGGSGSNKGEFIYELMCQQQQRTSEPSKVKGSYEYVYIDVEELIGSHIKQRINHLTASIQSEEEEEDTSDDGGGRGIMKKQTEQTEEGCVELSNLNKDSMRQCLTEFGNIVTNSWLLGLIEKEIEKHYNTEREKIFLVSLIPNRMSIFRHCLYLKQPPNFSHFNADFIAVNLTQINRKKKDLDIISSTSATEECIQNFLNYFQIHKKLIEVKIGNAQSRQRMRICRSKNAIPIRNPDDLFNFLKQSKKSEVELDISDFETASTPDRSLIFLVNNQIDTGREVLIIEDSDLSSERIRKFLNCYKELKST